MIEIVSLSQLEIARTGLGRTIPQWAHKGCLRDLFGIVMHFSFFVGGFPLDADRNFERKLRI